MSHSQHTLQIETDGQGLYEITRDVQACLAHSGISLGLCTVFVRHTSCSLTIQENADSSARYDLEVFLGRLVPENDLNYTHTAEGADDMPAHIKAALTSTSLGIPIQDGRVMLGTWQGIFLWEHRHASQLRSVIVHLSGDT